MSIDATHDPSLKSWVQTANEGGDFPVQNLPFGRFLRASGASPRCGVAIGDMIVDLAALNECGFMEGVAAQAIAAASGDDLAPLLRLGRKPARALREKLSGLLREGGDDRLRRMSDTLLVSQKSVEMLLPTNVRQFSDMCVSTFHIGRRNGNDERGEPICPPVFRTIPVGYDGRASSLVVSGTSVRRPLGTWQPERNKPDVVFGPEPRQDYELEMAIWLGGKGNDLGSPMSMREATEAIFGLGLLNDWSARGIQVWEMLLGPFLGKSMATTVSPWIVTVDALEPFRTSAFSRPVGDYSVPAHLNDTGDQRHGGFDIQLNADLITSQMGQAGLPAERLCETNFSYMYWTVAQMIAHHASNGCSLGAGDLLGSGTCSGPERAQAGCLIEYNIEGPLQLAAGESREWIEDGDTIILSAKASRQGFVSIGFGEARGTLLPSPEWPS
jgi:fumarylacetoacetase